MKLILLAFVGLAFGGYIALAQVQPQPRTIDFTQVVTGIEGKPIQNGDAHPVQPLTLGQAAAAALIASLPSDPTGTAALADKVKRSKLAASIYSNKAAKVSTIDLALIEERIGEVYPALVVGPAMQMLEP
jgi:hypothetical protein